MVICPADPGLQADIIFMIEATAVNGAYINDLKTNYVLPALEYFSQGVIDDTNFVSDNANSLYGIVLYQAADCLPHLCSDTLGPFSSPGKVISAIDKLELCGGKGESHANIAEGLATSLACFEELQQKRDPAATVQKHCILICNSPPYTMPVLESQAYSGKNAEQLAVILQEKNINLSVISPRKIPSLYKLFEKAGGDLTASLTKNYAKDPRHLVLLKGFSLKERPVSPPPGNNVASQSINNASIPMTSLPSPLPGCDSPSQSTNLLGQSNPSGVQQGQSPVYRPPSAGMGQMPQHVQQSMVSPNMSGMPQRQNMMGNNPMPNMAPNMAANMQQINAPPGYHAPNTLGAQRPQARWMMPPQQRPYMQPNQPNNPNQGSALIAQLSQPPSSVTNPQVNPYAQMNTNSTLQQQQQPPMKMNMSQHLQSSNPPNQSTQQQSMSQSQPGQVVTSQAQGANTPVSRPTIWQGLLEWIEKPKNATDQNKITKHVPCQVSANTKDGEPELKADGWPSKLIMQLMPKQLIGNIGGAYLKNSKSVLFHPQNCEALESLTKVMSSGFAGCVHFTSITNPAGCDIKVLILLYTAEKRAYLGFIPNDQGAFVDRLRKVIQQQKSSQQIMRSNQLPDASQIGLLQGNAGPSMNPQGGSLTMGGTPPQMGNNPVSSQPQQGLMMSQTNTMTMGGGQITQNVVSSTNQGAPGMAGVMGQNPGGGMQPRMRMPGIQQGMGGPQQGMGGPQQGMGGPQPNQQGMPGMMPPTGQVRENQLQAERQHNLDKINQMKQALEAAQQQEQQYKSQLERINHMKTNQLQEALQIAQQTEMQYKMMDQQRMNQSQQAANAQQQGQQRMMRPVMSNNPGLRHLLQQQPQYRQQVIGIQQMGGNPPRPQQMGQQMPNPGSNQSTFDDVSSFDFM